MEVLMSHIMQCAAGVKRAADDSPLDLTQKKFLRHTCDRLVAEEDLRQCSELSIESDFDVSNERVLKNSNLWKNASPTAKRVLRFGSGAPIQVKQEVGYHEKKPAPHPFSIEALLGDTINKQQCDDPQTPAVVYSYHTSRTPCTTTEVRKLKFNTSFWCHVCNSFCTDVRDAEGHQYLHSVRGIECNLKKEFFKKYGYVTKHIELDAEKMKCGLCDKTVTQYFFSKHQRIHDGHLCGICNQQFSCNSRLKDHMNIHSGRTPFSCKTCDRKFAKRSSLTQHQRYHRDHQSFKCRFCQKSFSSKYTREVHERLHTGKNPFKCQVPGCTRAFPQKIQLQLHMNTHK